MLRRDLMLAFRGNICILIFYFAKYSGTFAVFFIRVVSVAEVGTGKILSSFFGVWKEQGLLTCPFCERVKDWSLTETLFEVAELREKLH